MNEQPLFEPLSRREREILALLGENLSDREIAERLFLALPTVKWYNGQIYNKLGVENRRRAVKRANALGLLAQNDAAESAPVKHNLPSQLTPFVGRSRELSEIDGWLAHPHTRLLTILAPGGMGKTRLALEAAERSLSRYADGVFFAPLAALTSPDMVAFGLMEGLGLQFAPDNRTLGEQVIDFLRNKHLLLVIDNFEHLLDAAPLLTDLLTAAPKVTVLVTSRERLNLSSEVVYPLAGLHYPEADADEPLRFGAAQLFIECALRANPRFVAHDAAAIGQLCRRVQGMPLAIELAAAWSGTLPVDEIDAEIARSADFLSTPMANVPERQRSVQAVFEAAWARLDEDARRVFQRMSVFRGGCTREAAQAVAGASIHTLAALVAKALLWRDPQSGRFEIHELLRQYAEEKLEGAGETEGVQQAHQDYFADFSTHWGAALLDNHQLDGLAALDTDQDNVWLALNRAAERGVVDEIERFTDLWMYYNIRSRWHEIEDVFRKACESLQYQDSAVLAKLLSIRSMLHVRFFYYVQGCELGKQAMEVAERVNSPALMPAVMISYADGLNFTGQMEAAAEIYRDVIPLAEAQNQAIWTIQAYYQLGFRTWNYGQTDEARSLFNRAYSIARKMDNYWGMSFVLRSLGYLSMSTNDLEDAHRQFLNALDATARADFLCQRFGSSLGLSAVLRDLGDCAGARIHAEEAKSITDKIGTTDAALFQNLVLLAEIKLMLGEMDAARTDLLQSISLLEKSPQMMNWAYWYDTTSLYFSMHADFRRTAILTAASDHLDPEKKTYTDKERTRFEDTVDRCRGALSPEEFEAAWARGQTMSNEEAIALVAEAL